MYTYMCQYIYIYVYTVYQPLVNLVVKHVSVSSPLEISSPRLELPDDLARRAKQCLSHGADGLGEAPRCWEAGSLGG